MPGQPADSALALAGSGRGVTGLRIVDDDSESESTAVFVKRVGQLTTSLAVENLRKRLSTLTGVCHCVGRGVCLRDCAHF
jgi:hypothetical protein